MRNLPYSFANLKKLPEATETVMCEDTSKFNIATVFLRDELKKLLKHRDITKIMNALPGDFDKTTNKYEVFANL